MNSFSGIYSNKFVSFGCEKLNFKMRFSAVLLAFVGLLGLIIFSLTLGGVDISLRNILANNLSEVEESILFSIRIPRIIVALLVGASLAVAGANMQSLFRNPLADPSIIGISSGAALFVGVAIILFDGFSSVLGVYGLSVFAFLGALLTAYIVFKISKISQSSSVAYMLLAGIAVNAIAASGTGFLAFISNDEQLRTLTFWTMGSFSGALWNKALVAATLVIPSIFLLFRFSRQLNLLLLGEENAKYLGVETENLKKKIIILVTIIVGVSVAVSGIIGFVGLIIPHLLRVVYGSDNRFLTPAAAICGAGLMLISDNVARTILMPAELPVGIITSIIGGPYFLYLLIVNQKRG